MSFVTVTVKSPKMAILAARMRGLSEREVEKAIASALTYGAKDYVEYKKGRIDQDIDRPRTFTRGAYDWDGVKRGQPVLESRAYVRPKQAEYLEYPEYGGVKKHKAGEKDGPAAIAASEKDQYGGGYGKGGWQRKWLSKTPKRVAKFKGSGKSAYPAGTKLYRIFKLKNHGGQARFPEVDGIWELTKLSKAVTKGRRGLPGKWFGGKLKYRWKTKLIVRFSKEADYNNPRLHFKKDGMRFGKEKIPQKAIRLIDAAVERALGN
jgi:hypothetical protein